MVTQEDPRNQGNVPPDVPPDCLAAWIIGAYLVLEVAVLGYVGAMFWLAENMSELLKFPLQPPGFEFLGQTVSGEKFSFFRQLALAACSAGAGGSVFMIREFYLKFAYGKKNQKKGNWEYLFSREIPRYILLPFSSIVLGPISIFLLKAGAIIFTGFSSSQSIPDYTVMTVSFLFGFSYHDSLKALNKLSKKLTGGMEEEKKEKEEKEEKEEEERGKR